jgi:hypothetical protein
VVELVSTPRDATGAWNRYAFHLGTDFGTPANSTFTLAGNLAPAGYTVLCPTTRSCVPQLGTTSRLERVADDRLPARLGVRGELRARHRPVHLHTDPAPVAPASTAPAPTDSATAAKTADANTRGRRLSAARR